MAVSTIENEIRQAAVKRLGVAQVCVHRYVVAPFRPTRSNLITDVIDDSGVWFMLFVKRSADSEWEPIGRRRDPAELLKMIANYKRVSASAA